MAEPMTRSEESKLAPVAIASTFAEAVEAFCAQQADFRAKLALADGGRHLGPRDDRSPDRGAREGA